MWHRCGRNHADWPQIWREIPIRKKKRVRSRYPESQEGSREETNAREENQPWAESRTDRDQVDKSQGYTELVQASGTPRGL